MSPIKQTPDQQWDACEECQMIARAYRDEVKRLRSDETAGRIVRALGCCADGPRARQVVREAMDA